MNSNHPSEDSLDPKDLAKTRVIESDPGSGTPLHFGGARRRSHTPPPISDHELLGVIGQGAYGEVWLARNIMGAYRAVKIVYRDSFESDRPYEREFSGIQSFEPISRSHESQVDILHIGRNEAQKCFYYVMELADDASAESTLTRPSALTKATPDKSDTLSHLMGEGVRRTGEGRGEDCSSEIRNPKSEIRNWENYIPKTVHSELKRRGRFTFAESLEICLALTTAVEHLHKHGLIHRDIKPANVIFVNGLPKLADIGLVTETGGTMSFVGTEGYLPPEGPGSVQADIYSLGKTLYEVATGKDRFEFPELPTLTGSPSEETQLFELNEVLLKACHPDRDGRYRHASEMHADLVLLQAGKSIRRSRALEQRLALLTKIAGAVLLVASLSAAAYVYQQFQTREARRLAQAETFQRTRAEGLLKTVQSKQTENEHLLNTLQLKQAENFFEDDDANKGVAYLARMLRQNPSNHIAAARLMSALTDHSFALPVRTFEFPEQIHEFKLSPDGSRFAAWSLSETNTDGTVKTNCVVKIWSVATGEALGQPMRHSNEVITIRFSPDGRWIATTSKDGTVRIWDAESGKPASDPLTFTNDEPQDIEFSRDSQLLITPGWGKVHFWSVPGGERIMPPIDVGEGLWAAKLSPDGERILTATLSFRCDLWDARTGRHLLNLDSEPLEVRGPEPQVSFSPDGSLFAAATGKKIVVWDARSGKFLLRLLHDGSVVRSRAGFRFSPDGLRIVSGDDAGSVRVWDARTGQPLILPIKHKMDIWRVEFDPTGERILTQQRSRSRVWDSRTGQPVTEWIPNSWRNHFSPDGRHVLTHDHTKAVLWDVLPGAALNLILRHRGAAISARFNATGDKLVTANKGWEEGQSLNEAVVWNARMGQIAAPEIKSRTWLWGAEFSPDGQRIVTASQNGQARVWDVHTGKPVTEPMQHEEGVTFARFSPDGRAIATGSLDGAMRVWDAQSGRLLAGPLAISERGDFSGNVEFSPNGHRILGFIRDQQKPLRIWDFQTGTVTEMGLPGEKLQPSDAHFSPDGKRVVAGYVSEKALIWDSETGQLIGGPLRHQGPVWTARYSPDGSWILTSSVDQTARVWDALTGRAIGEPMMHHGLVSFARFSQDSRRVVTLSMVQNQARIWDVETGRPLTEPLRHDAEANWAEFSPDGSRLVTASANEASRLWELPRPIGPVPDWVLTLAEAVAGHRVLDQETPDAVRAEELLALKQRIMSSVESDYYTVWAKWFLSDRLERGVSLSSPVKGTDHLGGLVKWNSVQTLREALRLSPLNAEATARLAREILAKGPKEYPHKEQVAAFLAERALKLKPDEPQAWWAKAAVLEQTGKGEEALQALERALALVPKSLELWNLKSEWLDKAGRDEEALLACSKALDLVEPSLKTPVGDAKNPETDKRILLKRSELLARSGRQREAVADRLRALNIPARDPQPPAALVDLSAHYNYSLHDNQWLWLPDKGSADFASLARTKAPLLGVQFDLRGSIRVGHSSSRDEQAKMVRHARGIHVNQKCRRLHFLHAILLGPENVPTVRYIVHYEDGRSEEIPVVIEKNAGHWGSDGSSGEAEVAWREADEVALVSGFPSQLYKWIWVNPRPDVRITSIDLELPEAQEPMSPRAFVLAAITAQAEPDPVITTQPISQSLAAGEAAVFRVGARSESPLAYQWQFNGKDLSGTTNETLSLTKVAANDAGIYTVKVWNAIEASVLTLSSERTSLVVRDANLSFGALRREVFTNIVGSKLNDLTNHTRFPGEPDGVDLVHQFEAPSNFAENYGVRLTGYLVPPKSGEYRFYLCSDDEGALFLSTDESPEHKRQIAHEPEWNLARLWTASHSRPKHDNVSEPIHLEAGRHYYIEALMKEGENLDNLAVAWQMPGEPPPENLAPPIPGTYLAVPAEWTEASTSPLASGSKVP